MSQPVMRIVMNDPAWRALAQVPADYTVQFFQPDAWNRGAHWRMEVRMPNGQLVLAKPRGDKFFTLRDFERVMGGL